MLRLRRSALSAPPLDKTEHFQRRLLHIQRDQIDPGDQIVVSQITRNRHSQRRRRRNQRHIHSPRDIRRRKRLVGLGDLKHFWAGETSADVGWDLGMYMSGFFPCMMFGIPGAALAMVRTAKNKKAAIGLVVSAAICAFVCGVTEPFEFGFMFLCFPLYVVYAALYGIFTIITYYSGFRAGFCFSAGATDLVFSASLPAAAKTWMIIPLGIAAFVVFYLVFYFAITKFDLKTPGREDDDVEESEKNIKLSNNNYTAIATVVLAAVGGKENITGADYCATRLRLEVKDSSAVNEKAVKAAGAAGVIRPSKTSCQVVIGPQVQFVFDELKKML